MLLIMRNINTFHLTTDIISNYQNDIIASKKHLIFTKQDFLAFMLCCILQIVAIVADNCDWNRI